MTQTTKTGSLTGLRIASFESRLGSEMAKMLAKRGAEVLQAPTMQEVPLEDNTEALQYGEVLMRGDCDAMVLLTGVGTQILIEALATRWSLAEVTEALTSTYIIARSAKPVAALKKYKLKADLVAPEPNTWKELLNTVDTSWPVNGKHICIQEYGERNLRLVEGLVDRGAQVSSVPVYGWQLPDDIAPLEKAIEEVVAGKVDCVAFTSAHQIRNLMLIAKRIGREAELRQAVDLQDREKLLEDHHRERGDKPKRRGSILM